MEVDTFNSMHILRIEEGEQIAEFSIDFFNKSRVNKIQMGSVEMKKCPEKEKIPNACLFFLLQIIVQYYQTSINTKTSRFLRN